MLRPDEAKGPTTQLNMELPKEIVERFKDVNWWLSIEQDAAGEAALLLYVQAKENEIKGVFAPRPEGARRTYRADKQKGIV